MRNLIRKFFKKILYNFFGIGSGCCKISNKVESTNDIQQKSYADSN